jgi:hypothetical protein
MVDVTLESLVKAVREYKYIVRQNDIRGVHVVLKKYASLHRHLFPLLFLHSALISLHWF